MSQLFPVRQGFRVAFREPAVVLAEIAWRWTFGTVALALVAASVLAFLDTIPVGHGELLALRSRTPYLIADAIVHFFRGTGPRLARLVIILTPALAMLWIAAASLGRAATLRTLLAVQNAKDERPLAAPLIGLHFLRAALVLTALIAGVGAAILAGLAATTGPQDRPGVFLVVFLVLISVIAALRSRISWFLCLGSIFAVRDRRDTFGAIRDAVHLFGRQKSGFLATGAMFALLRGFAMAVATVASLVALALIGRVSDWVVTALLGMISLGYFAVSDFLYVARLAAYVAIDEDDRAPGLEPPPAPLPDVPAPAVVPQLPAQG